MEDPHDQDPNNLNHQEMRNEPVRSRWTPKPEQILILESIFNSGMVNPPKDETVRIRKLLEKFGAVGDANVFYWFQNRRSRSRRRQRQMQQAAAAAAEQRGQVGGGGGGGSTIQYENSNNNYMGIGTTSSSNSFSSSYASCYNNSNNYGQSSSSCGYMCQDEFENFYGNDNSMSSCQLGFGDADHQHHHQSSILCSSDTSNMAYQSGFITVFMNGVPTEVPRGPFDMKALFGEDVLLVHSSGVPLPTNEFGFLMQSLEHGESYFLVSKQT